MTFMPGFSMMFLKFVQFISKIEFLNGSSPKNSMNVLELC